MPDYGQPGSYLTLAEGTPVYGSDGGEVGEVAHVLAVVEEDIFDGVVINAGGTHRFVDAPEVGNIYERGVILKITAAEAEQLPEPAENPGAMAVDPDDTVKDSLGDKLHRAWLKVSGKY